MEPVWKGGLEWGRQGNGLSGDYAVEGKTSRLMIDPQTSLLEGLTSLLDTAWNRHPSVNEERGGIQAIGHRVVHGGTELSAPVLMTPRIKEIIRSLEPLAPLHNPSNLQGIELAESLFPRLPQIAVFDTGFHASIPEQAFCYPIPRDWRMRGIRKYGFHGISHGYLFERACALLELNRGNCRIVTCHLGNGSSLAAVRNGVCVDTSMGFTPLDGLMMGTRSGSIDPGILLHLIRQEHLSYQELEEGLYQKSGLLGMCGSSDMREVLVRMNQGDPRAALAFEMYVYRLKCGIGSLAAALGGIDALVFSGGIGENAAEVRAAAVEGLAFLGMELDPVRNGAGGQDRLISATESLVPICVIPTREEYAIAQSVRKILGRPT